MASILGLRKRNIAPDQGVTEKVYCITVPNRSGQTSQSHHFRFKNTLEAMKLVELTASADSAPAGFTTFTVDVTNSTASLLTTPLSLDGLSQEVRVGTLASDVEVDAGETITVSIVVTGVEAYQSLLVTLRFRSLLGAETRL